MKCAIFFSGIILAVLTVAQSTSLPYPTTTWPPTYPTATLPPATPKPPCGSYDHGDYKGACDESVPVVVLPKGRPIMERILDWFKCDDGECEPSTPTVTTGTSWTPTMPTLPYPTGYPTAYPPGSSPPAPYPAPPATTGTPAP